MIPSVQFWFKAFGGTALTITFIWWTIVSFIKHKGEPTSTEMTFTVLMNNCLEYGMVASLPF